MLQLNDVHKTYGQKDNVYEALRGVTLAIQDGESVAIIGKSGSGKSTLMHIMAGLDTPTSGTVEIDGVSLGKMSEQERALVRNEKFGFVFQQYFLQPRLTVLENILLPLTIRGVGAGTRKKRAEELLSAVGLTDKAKNLSTDLSGGQKQRVAIARALANTPRVIFADEPTGNLDTEIGESIIKLLFDVHKNNHTTLVVVTHDEDLAKRCDRMLTIQDGKIV